MRRARVMHIPGILVIPHPSESAHRLSHSTPITSRLTTPLADQRSRMASIIAASEAGANGGLLAVRQPSVNHPTVGAGNLASHELRMQLHVIDTARLRIVDTRYLNTS